MSAPPPTSTPARFALVDALRGIAASAVVFHHVYDPNLSRAAERPFPALLHGLMVHGDCGVFVFFVLSGFVIAHSLGKKPLSKGYVGRFALRRSLRLDPPYWAALALLIVTNYALRTWLHRSTSTIPDWPTVLGHVFYLQYFLEMTPLLGIAWTLCLEIQFYLVLVLLTAVGRSVDRDVVADREGSCTRFLLTAVTLVGAAARAGWISNIPGLFLDYWPYFAGGVVSYWSGCGRLPSYYAAAWVVVMACLFGRAEPYSVATAVGTAALLYAGLRSSRIMSWSLGPVAQYLGRISYSLYLTHMLTGCRCARFIMERRWNAFNQLELAGYTLLCFAVSVACAHAFYLLIERPSHRLSKRVPLERAS